MTSQDAANTRRTPSDSGFHAALTIEGGGTLGAYESGLTWALLEVFRRRRILHAIERGDSISKPAPLDSASEGVLRSLNVFQLHAIAGASAGSINAFIAGNRWCAVGPFADERASPFWEVWVPTGFMHLFPKRGDPASDSATGIFKRSHFDWIFANLEKTWKASGYDPKCSLSVGATMTRLADDSLEVSTRVHARNQRYAAAFSVESPTVIGVGPRYRRRVSTTEDRIRVGALVELPSAQDGTISKEFVHGLIKASSGYPLAFEPYPVYWCEQRGKTISEAAATRRCTQDSATVSYFVDGGVFDNGPLTLAYGLSLADAPQLSLDNLRMLFINPSQRRNTRGRQDIYSARRAVLGSDTGNSAGQRPLVIAQASRAVEDTSRGVDAVAKLLGNFIPSARQYELQIAARFLPTVQQADRRGDSLRVNIARAREEGRVERDRANSEYQLRKAELRRGLVSVEGSNYSRDSLRYVLALCRLDPTTCGLPTADDSVAVPAEHQAIPDSVPIPVEVQAVALTDNGSGAAFGKLLFVSDRFHPVAGEWLFGFGGLIGRPLREYDFYVGVYDAFALIAQQMQCAKPTDEECLQLKLRELLATPPLVLSAEARAVLAELYQQEFEQPAGTQKYGPFADSSRTQVLLDIVNAMGARMSRTALPRTACRKGGNLERMNCSQGMDAVFGQLRDSGHFAAFSERVPGCPHSSSDADCGKDKFFVSFVEDPRIALNSLAGQVLERVNAVTPGRSGLKLPLTMINAVYFATNERGREGFDLGSVSLPSLTTPQLFVWSLVPSGIGGIAGFPGWYTEWAWRVHVDANYALGATARTYWATALIRPGERSTGRHFVPSIRAEWKPAKSAPWVSTIALDVSYWSDWQLKQFVNDKGVSGGITVALLAQRLRVSAFTAPKKYILKRGVKPDIFVTIGAGDASGTLYWLGRTLDQKWRRHRR